MNRHHLALGVLVAGAFTVYVAIAGRAVHRRPVGAMIALIRGGIAGKVEGARFLGIDRQAPARIYPLSFTFHRELLAIGAEQSGSLAGRQALADDEIIVVPVAMNGNALAHIGSCAEFCFERRNTGHPRLPVVLEGQPVQVEGGHRHAVAGPAGVLDREPLLGVLAHARRGDAAARRARGGRGQGPRQAARGVARKR